MCGYCETAEIYRRFCCTCIIQLKRSGSVWCVLLVSGYSVAAHHGADDSVENDGSELIEERPRRHEVAGVDDDRRQQYEEERASVELMLVSISGVGDVQQTTNDDAEHDQQTALRHRLQQLLLRVVS